MPHFRLPAILPSLPRSYCVPVFMDRLGDRCTRRIGIPFPICPGKNSCQPGPDRCAEGIVVARREKPRRPIAEKNKPGGQVDKGLGILSRANSVPDGAPALFACRTNRQPALGLDLNLEPSRVNQKKLKIARGRVAFVDALRIPSRVPEPPLSASRLKRAERLRFQPCRFYPQGLEITAIGVAQNGVGARGDAKRQPACDSGFRERFDGHGRMLRMIALFNGDQIRTQPLG